MESRRDVVIVSAFGRGVWLALELAKKGLQVTFVDVSEKLGHSKPEDWQGPFPLIKSTQLDDLQWEFLSEGSQIQRVENGFTFWLSSGPWELSGPLLDFLREKNGISEETVRYIRDFHVMSEPERRLIKHQIESVPGHENWLAHFAHQHSASVYFQDRMTLEGSIPLSLFSPCYIRQMSKATIDSYYSKMKKAGIIIYQEAKIEDLSIQSRILDGIEVASDRSGIVTGQKFIWMLTGEEGLRFNPRITNGLFGGSVAESSWSWIRFLMKVEDGPECDVLPKSFAMAKDIHMPWTHGNLCLTERTSKAGLFRVWIRVASGRRFQRSYMTEMTHDVHKEFQKRLPAVKINIEEMPPEFHFGFEELGPPRYPVFTKSEIKKVNRVKLRNVYHLSPEDWGGLDWGTRMSAENRMLFTLTAENEIQKTREEDHDRALHPN